MGAAEDQIGVLGTDAAACLLRHAGLGTQQEEAAPDLVELGQHVSGKVDAGYPLLQRCAQNFGGINHADAVWQDQIGLVQDAAELWVLL